jgi:hypothetical protein
MTYNLTFMNGTTINDIIVGVNVNSGGLYGFAILLCSYFICFVVFSHRSTPDALVANTFINALIAGVMYGLNLLPLWALGIVFVMFAISILYKMHNE